MISVEVASVVESSVVEVFGSSLVEVDVDCEEEVVVISGDVAVEVESGELSVEREVNLEVSVDAFVVGLDVKVAVDVDWTEVLEVNSVGEGVVKSLVVSAMILVAVVSPFALAIMVQIAIEIPKAINLLNLPIILALLTIQCRNFNSNHRD